MRWQGEIDRPKHEPDAIDEAISSGYRTREIQGAGARDGTVSRKHDYDPLHHTEVVASDAARLNFDRVVFTFDAKARSARNYQRGEAAYKAKRDARLRLEADVLPNICAYMHIAAPLSASRGPYYKEGLLAPEFVDERLRPQYPSRYDAPTFVRLQRLAEANGESLWLDDDGMPIYGPSWQLPDEPDECRGAADQCPLGRLYDSRTYYDNADVKNGRPVVLEKEAGAYVVEYLVSGYRFTGGGPGRPSVNRRDALDARSELREEVRNEGPQAFIRRLRAERPGGTKKQVHHHFWLPVSNADQLLGAAFRLRLEFLRLRELTEANASDQPPWSSAWGPTKLDSLAVLLKSDPGHQAETIQELGRPAGEWSQHHLGALACFHAFPAQVSAAPNFDPGPLVAREIGPPAPRIREKPGPAIVINVKSRPSATPFRVQ